MVGFNLCLLSGEHNRRVLVDIKTLVFLCCDVVGLKNLSRVFFFFCLLIPICHPVLCQNNYCHLILSFCQTSLSLNNTCLYKRKEGTSLQIVQNHWRLNLLLSFSCIENKSL